MDCECELSKISKMFNPERRTVVYILGCPTIGFAALKKTSN